MEIRSRKLAGFTLAELLVALAILAIIATFTIPKVLSSQQDSKRKAVFRETIATLNLAIYNGNLNGNLSETTFTSLPNHVNHVKNCPANAYTQGCWGGANAGEASKPGFTMHNGASVCGLDDTANGTHEEWVYIDWDGPNNGTNTEGDDQLHMRFFFDGNPTKPVGRMQPVDASDTLLYDIFSN